MKSRVYFSLLACWQILILISFAQEPSREIIRLPSDLEKELLAENWEAVFPLLSQIKARSDPVIRFLSGHACLALNRNNDSFEFFLSGSNPSDRNQWKNWTAGFAQNHPKSSVALYLKGDALARLEEWEAANLCLTQSVELNKESFLALNALGIVSHALGNAIKARSEFLRATKANPNFADAYSSRGTLSVYQNSATAKASYLDAQKRSKDTLPILIINGLGCAEYGAEDFDQARKHFETAATNAKHPRLPRQNALATGIAKLNKTLAKANAVGTSIKLSQFSDRGIPPTDPDEIGPDVTPVEVVVDEDGTIWIRLSDGRLVKISPPAPPDDEDDDNDDDGDDPPPGGGGSELVGKPNTVGSVNAMIKGFRSRSRLAATLSSPGRLSPKEYSLIVRGIEAMDVRVANATASATTVARSQASARTPVKEEFGGATSDSSNSRVNKGRWSVRNVYGLLYDIPRRTGKSVK